MRIAIACLLMAGSLAGCSNDAPTEPEAGPVVLNIHGAIDQVDRGPVIPDTEPLLVTLDIRFAEALALTRADLAALPQHTVMTDYPAGAGSRVFSGPRVRDVLALAEPRGERATFTALDGYRRDIALHRFDEFDAILAIAMENEPLPLGGFGPAMLVWPRRDEPALSGMPDDDWVWGVVAIEIAEP